MWAYKTPPKLNDQQYSQWQSLLEKRTGIYFSKHRSIIQTGLIQRMREIGIQDYECYFQQVSAEPHGMIEWARLVDKISVNETRFFRESNAISAVRNYLIDLLDKNNNADKAFPLDLWSVGCSTGEEAYSLAMTANEVIDYLSANCFLGVTATDISQVALSTARQGYYSFRKLEDMPLALKNKYFVKRSDGGYDIDHQLRQRICFAQGNLLELDKKPKSAMDIIYCQNVLIYFRKECQEQVLNELVEHLKPGGLLVVGLGEAAGWEHPAMLSNIDKTVQTFTKRHTIEIATFKKRQLTNPKKVARI